MATALKQEILPAEEEDADIEQQLIAAIKNPRAKLFVDIHLAGKSATQAAIEAGYSDRNASVQASRMLRLPEIAKYVAFMKSKASQEAVYSAARWQRELIGIAHSNVQDFTRLNDQGELEVDFSNATREQLAAVQSVKTKKRTIYDNRGNVVGEESQNEFRLWDKLRAAELLGKHAGFLKEPEQKVIVDVADRLLSARQRVMRTLPERAGSSDASGDEAEMAE